MAARVAVVDDETVFLDLLDDLLSAEGYEAHRFPPSAAEYTHLRALAPDVVILDVHPEQDGAAWELLTRMRQDALLRTTPIILCAADAPLPRERRAEVEREGCAVLAKPFDLVELLALVERSVGNGRPA